MSDNNSILYVYLEQCPDTTDIDETVDNSAATDRDFWFYEICVNVISEFSKEQSLRISCWKEWLTKTESDKPYLKVNILTLGNQK